MAIVNRDKDTSEQRECFGTALVGTVTGQTYNVCVVPYPAQVVSAAVCGNGLSGAPNYSLWVQRMVAGVGITSVCVGNSLVLTTFGTSGPQGFSTSGLSFLLQANDAIVLSTAAANTATVTTTVTVVLKALQDIKTHFGV